MTEDVPPALLYEQYHSTSYNAAKVDGRVEELLSDPFVHNSKGVYEFVLSGETEPQLLAVRLFDDKTKAQAYKQQTDKAKAASISNCPLCAVGNNANKTRISRPNEMDADHVTAWSKGGPRI